MGDLSIKIKLDLFGFLNCLSTLYCLVILFSIFDFSIGLYEDQIGKFDWKQTYVGRLKYSHFDTVSKSVIVATEDNVVAALNLKSGQILWRKVLESTSNGEINLLHVDEEIVVVSGSGQYVIRGWDSTTGYLLWQWSLWLQHPEQAQSAEWWIKDDVLYSLIPKLGSHIEVTAYNLRTGQNRGSTSKFPASWVNKKCVLSGPFYTCLSGSPGSYQLISLDVTSNAVQLLTKSLHNVVPPHHTEVHLKKLPGILPGVIVNNKVLLCKTSSIDLVDIEITSKTTGIHVVSSVDGPVLVQIVKDDDNFKLMSKLLATGELVAEMQGESTFEQLHHPTISSSVCIKTQRERNVCRFLLTDEDSTVYLMQNTGKVMWFRDESLARIVGVEMVDLPISDMDAAIETEFTNKQGDPISMALRRIRSQLQQLVTLLQWTTQSISSEVLVGETKSDSRQSASLYRDVFGLHKIIIVVTETGKIFALDNLSGEVLWWRRFPEICLRGNPDARVSLLLQRSARHPPHDAVLTIVTKHKLTGNGILLSFNPINGELLNNGLQKLSYKINQVVLLHQTDPEFLKGIAILDNKDSVTIFPPETAMYLDNMFMFVADRDAGIVQGYALSYDGKVPQSRKTWLLRLGGIGEGKHNLIDIVPKNPLERVHSQGKVMGDRSVLYKYINPNLVAFVARGSTPNNRDSIIIYLIDVVSGSIIYSHGHKKARGPIHLVHSENWIVYTYYNEKARRVELVTVELNEGPVRSLQPGASFESLGSQGLVSVTGPAQVEKQAFILSASPLALAPTITDRGITAKHVLMALSTGSLLEMPWVLLDPRRPVGPVGPEAREEGLIPYTPELPLAAEAVISYNHTLEKLRNIYVSSSGLESTCLVLATGLDLFYTRVAPSKTFDLLKEDFDYFLIAIVLIALIVASYASKFFASKKMLRQAWK